MNEPSAPLGNQPQPSELPKKKSKKWLWVTLIAIGSLIVIFIGLVIVSSSVAKRISRTTDQMIDSAPLPALQGMTWVDYGTHTEGNVKLTDPDEIALLDFAQQTLEKLKQGDIQWILDHSTKDNPDPYLNKDYLGKYSEILQNAKITDVGTYTFIGKDETGLYMHYEVKAEFPNLGPAILEIGTQKVNGNVEIFGIAEHKDTDASNWHKYLTQ